MLSLPLAAQPRPDSENGRYTFQDVADAILRLDTRTGQVALCRPKDPGWACQTVADERLALEAEIARLQQENASLKKELVDRGLPLPGISGNDVGTKSPQIRLPSDADLDRVMSFMEKVWRRLLEMVHNAQRDFDKKS